MELRLIVMALVCLCIAQLAFAVEDTYQFASTTQQKRFTKLIKELRCAECQNQTLFDSNAPLALDMRAQIHKMINSGASDKDIRNFFNYRYGDYISFKPALRSNTMLLWCGPFIMVALGIIFLIRAFVPRRREYAL